MLSEEALRSLPYYLAAKARNPQQETLWAILEEQEPPNDRPKDD